MQGQSKEIFDLIFQKKIVLAYNQSIKVLGACVSIHSAMYKVSIFMRGNCLKVTKGVVGRHSGFSKNCSNHRFSESNGHQDFGPKIALQDQKSFLRGPSFLSPLKIVLPQESPYISVH